jgi:hypothetical protein
LRRDRATARAPDSTSGLPAFLLGANRGVRRMTETDYAEFDELHRTWLVRPRLHLSAIISLARGVPQERWIEAHTRYRADCLALKTAITAGLLKAHYNRSLEMRYDNTVVNLTDLLRYLERTGPEDEWLQKFAKRWEGHCASAGINVVETKKAESRPQYSTAEVKQSYGEWISSLKVHPTMNQSDKWLSEHFDGFKRKTFRDEISRPMMPEEWLRTGPRSTKVR